jgi:signal peptidase I
VAAGLVFGIRPLVVQTGSMSPTIDAGALAWGKHVAADDLAVGDVVVVPKGDGHRVTHRIVAIQQTNTGTFVQLKGDANPTVDAQLYPVGDDVYRVFADVPYGGRVVAWFSGPIGLFLLGMYAMSLLFIAFRPRRDDDDSSDDDPSQGAGDGRGGKRAARRMAATSVAAFAVVVTTVAPSWATFTDGVPVSDTSLRAGSLVTPTLTCVRDSASQVTISWTAASSPAAHTYTSAIVQNSQGLAVNSSGTTRSVVVTTALLAGTIGTTATVRVTGSLGGTSWVAPDATQSVTTTSGGTNIACGTTIVDPLPVTCSVVGTNGDWKVKLDWTYGPPDPATKFQVRSTAGSGAVPGTPADVAKTLRTWTSTGFVSKAGQIWVVAVEGATEVESVHINYDFGSGNGSGNKICPVP